MAKDKKNSFDSGMFDDFSSSIHFFQVGVPKEEAQQEAKTAKTELVTEVDEKSPADIVSDTAVEGQKIISETNQAKDKDLFTEVNLSSGGISLPIDLLNETSEAETEPATKEVTKEVKTEISSDAVSQVVQSDSKTFLNFIPETVIETELPLEEREEVVKEAEPEEVILNTTPEAEMEPEISPLETKTEITEVSSEHTESPSEVPVEMERLDELSEAKPKSSSFSKKETEGIKLISNSLKIIQENNMKDFFPNTSNKKKDLLWNAILDELRK